VRRTPILLLDEPTTGLDPATKRDVVDTLLAVISERTAVLATHDLELAARADEIVLLVAGRIVERGTYDELYRDSAEFRRLADALEVEEA
jgi:ABC-type multidrug transport system fused ATPase/permease subunit